LLWSLDLTSEGLELVPGPRGDGEFTRWEGGSSFPLSAPILAFTVDEMLDDAFVNHVKSLLETWIKIDQANLVRISRGVREFRMPVSYATNEAAFGNVMRRPQRVVGDPLKVAIAELNEPLRWITEMLFANDDMRGAIRGILLHGYLFKNQRPDLLKEVHNQLATKFREIAPEYKFPDDLATVIDREIDKLSPAKN
jgi:hypothetical protein